ncbi:hypothetical protein [Rhizobium leguminosarum]|nr:hypothetical protein [Rhizobium leguminosarum]
MIAISSPLLPAADYSAARLFRRAKDAEHFELLAGIRFLAG